WRARGGPNRNEALAVLREVGDEAVAERHRYLGARLQGARLEQPDLGAVSRIDGQRERAAALRHRDAGNGRNRRMQLYVARLLLSGLGVEREQPSLLAAAVGRDVDGPPVGRELRREDGDLAAGWIQGASRTRGEVEQEQVVLGARRNPHEES